MIVTTLLQDVRTGISISVVDATTRLLAWAGDPVARLDTHTPGRDDPFVILSAIRAKGRLVRSRTGVWVTASHDVCRAVLRSAAASSLNYSNVGGHPLDDSFIGMDPPDHTRLRRLVLQAFTPRAIAAHRPRIAAIAGELLDACPTNRPIDLVESFAAPLPMAVICDLLGLPAGERGRFFGWGEILVAALDRVRSLATARALRQANTELRAYLTAVVAERRRRPEGDLVSELVAAADQGDRLNDAEIVSTLTLLLVAGFETTVNVIGTGTHNLLRTPVELARVAGDLEAHVGNLVEESLRFEGPVMFTFRTALDDIDVGQGEVLRRGSHVVLGLAGANRDPAVFIDPDCFDVTRANSKDHLAFGGGPHYCLGAALARLEAEIAWRTLLDRFPRLQLAGPATYRPAPILRGLATLPVVLDG